MPSYRCELTGLCGHKVKLIIWNDRFIMECDREGYSEKLQRKITIPYIKEVREHCMSCGLKEERTPQILG